MERRDVTERGEGVDGKALSSVGGLGSKPAPAFINEAFVKATGDGEREGEGTAADLKLRSPLRGETDGLREVTEFGVTTAPIDMRLPVLDDVENAGRAGPARDLERGEGPAVRMRFSKRKANNKKRETAKGTGTCGDS